MFLFHAMCHLCAREHSLASAYALLFNTEMEYMGAMLFRGLWSVMLLLLPVPQKLAMNALSLPK
jgi:hypothetical protein